ncbi:MAG TPA: alpha/beta hydrolase [Burkholderiales bacterium]|nr:alpha/beta hydrolase [Burkholderiales bacterium]
MHVLEAGFETKGRPCVLLLHGFPELAYSWRKVMLPIAQAGYHVLAPDQRGYGRTTGWDPSYDGDLHSFHLLSIARDALALVYAFGYRSVAAVIGHDFGSPVAGLCALTRPDVFRSVVMMSAPLPGVPDLPFDTVERPAAKPEVENVIETLPRLPRPRKHYQWYYSGREANEDMWHCPQGVRAFMRAYYHYKSADWKQNKPYRLAARTATELAKMPTYYIMDADKNMAQTVEPEMPSAAEIAACKWLTEDELRVYSTEYERTGFQGGLQWYRTRFVPEYNAEFQLFSSKTIDVPSAFIAGKSDWGVYQWPGDFEAMQTKLCTNMVGVHLLDGAGHWVQQEQAEEVNRLLLEFLSKYGG